MIRTSSQAGWTLRMDSQKGLSGRTLRMDFQDRLIGKTFRTDFQDGLSLDVMPYQKYTDATQIKLKSQKNLMNLRLKLERPWYLCLTLRPIFYHYLYLV